MNADGNTVLRRFVGGFTKPVAVVALSVVFLGLSALGLVALASHGLDYIDLASSAGLTVVHDDAVFAQGGVGAGTGTFDPFTTAQPGGSTSPEEAITVCDDPGCPLPQFHTFTGGGRTHEILLSAIPELVFNGISGIPDGTYREFTLDANDTGNDDFMSIDDIRIYLDTQVDLTGFGPGAGTFSNDNAPSAILAYDLDVPVLMRTQTFTPGSGVSDFTLLVPTSAFSTTEDCAYGSTECDHWVYFYFKAGDPSFSDELPPELEDADWDVSSGFEEWRTRFVPVVNVQKDANTSFELDYDWTVTKSADPLQLHLFDGDSDSVEWTVEWIRDDGTASNVQVSGTITILNPTGSDEFPISEDIPAEINSVVDVLNAGGFAGFVSVDCGVTFPHVLDAGDSLICSYSQAVTTDDNGTNDATVNIDLDDEGTLTADYQAMALVDFTEALVEEIDETATLTDDRPGHNVPGAATDDGLTSWTETFACDADEGQHSNTVTLTEDDTSTLHQSTATTEVFCYTPTISKTAAGDYDENHDWTVEKTVDPGSLDGFIGGSAGSADWLVTVTETVTWSDFAVTGTVTISNPHPTDSMSIALSDNLVGDATAVMFAAAACDGNDPNPNGGLTVDAGETVNCDYSASPADTSATGNHAEFTLFSITNEADAFFTWQALVVGPTSVDLTDLEGPLNEVVSSNGPDEGSTDTPFPYTREYFCSFDQADYAGDGHHEQDVDNTAVIKDGETELDSASAHLDIDCYAPLISKTAAGDYNENHAWDVDKSVDPGSLDGFIAGPAGDADWLVTVTETVSWSDFAVSGIVTITNPHPTDTMLLSLSDVLNDATPGVFANDACNGDDPNPNDGLDLLGGETVDCGYSALPSDTSATENTATVTLNAIDFDASDPIEWTAHLVGPLAVDLTDDEGPLNQPVPSFGGAEGSFPTDFPYTNPYVCSSDPADYAGDGHHEQDVDNTAVIKDGDTELDSATAHLDIDCYAPLLSKNADTSFDRTYTWDIEKTASETELTLMPGQTFVGVQYTVTLDVIGVVDDNFGVEGTVTISNPHPTDTMMLSLSDVLDDTTPGGFAADACDGSDPNPNDGLNLAGGETVHCDYSAAPLDKSSTLNTATVTLNSIDFDATAPVDWSDGAADINEIDECVTVEDTFAGVLGSACADEAPKDFTYSRDFGPFTVEQCGELDFPNIASFETNDTQATGSDDHNVHVIIPCPTGCTLTLGYWKTHSILGPAPFDDNWDNLPDVDGDGLFEAEGEDFFLSGQSWYEVFWTAPKGNAYYNLAHQYMAAVLNILNGASVPTAVGEAIADAETLFGTHTPADIGALKGKQPPRPEFIELAGILGDYNEGEIGPGHCDEDGTSVSWLIPLSLLPISRRGRDENEERGSPLEV